MKKKILEKQSGRQAVPPSPPAFIAKAIEEAKKVEVEPLPNEDEILAQGSDSDFWKILKRYIKTKIKNLKKQTTLAVVKGGYNLEEAGFRYVLTDQICHALKDIIKYVEFRRKMVEEMKKEEAKRKEVRK